MIDLETYGSVLISAFAFMQEAADEESAHLLGWLPRAAARGHLFADIDPDSGECRALAIMGPAEWRDVSLTDGALGPNRLGRGEALACVWFAARDHGATRLRRMVRTAARDWPSVTHLVASRRGRPAGAHIRAIRRVRIDPGAVQAPSEPLGVEV